MQIVIESMLDTLLLFFVFNDITWYASVSIQDNLSLYLSSIIVLTRTKKEKVSTYIFVALKQTQLNIFVAEITKNQKVS